MANKKPDIIYEDKDILILNKPAGLIVESEKKEKKTLVDILGKKYNINLPRSGIVHRLDKDTSGLMIVAKNENALVDLQNQFASRKIKKIYYALVLGKLEPGKGRIELSLKRDPKNRTRFIASKAKDAKEAITGYEVLNYFNVGTRHGAETRHGVSLLKAVPITGRTHQIRAHFFAIGYPIIGDQVYKNKQSFEASKKLGLNRQFLHAGEIKFIHPKTGKQMHFKCDLAEDLREILNKLM